MHIRFKNIKPVSTNHKNKIGRSGVFKSKEYKEMIRQATLQLTRYFKQMVDFEASYKPTEQFLVAHYTFYIPYSKLFTKKKTISKKSLDIDNCVKPINDVIFKHFDNLDDAFIFDMQLCKKPSLDNNYHIDVFFEINDLAD